MTRLERRKYKRLKVLTVIEFIVIGLILRYTDVLEIKTSHFVRLDEPKPSVVYNVEVTKITEVEFKPATSASQNCIDLIKEFEGFKAESYKLDGESNYTIGYGTCNKSIHSNMRVTKAQAHDMLMSEVNDITEYILSKDLNLNQNELDALISFTYNLGKGNLNKLINNRSKEEIPEHILAYTGSKSKNNKNGLTRRRLAEYNLYMEDLKNENN